MTRRRKALAVLTAAALGGTALAAWTGWFERPKPWPSATGWERLPLGERPQLDDAPLWTSPDGSPGPRLAGPRLAWLGHAGMVIDWRGRRILLDPNVSPRCTIVRRMLEPAVPAERLGPVDAVLISHAHYDHLDLPTLEALTEIGLLVVPRGAASYLPEALAGRTEVAELEVDESVALGDLEITAVFAAHNGNRRHPLHSKELAVGYVLRDRASGEALYYAGDTGASAPFAEVAARFHPRAAILPIGAYSPRIVLAPYHLSPEEAVEAARTLQVDIAVPTHFGTFTLFFDRPSAALPRFARAARQAGVRWRMPVLWTEGMEAPR